MGNMITQAFDCLPVEFETVLEQQKWHSLRAYFAGKAVDSLTIRDFIREVQSFYRRKTGRWICRDNHYEMASVGVPLLCSRLVELGILEDGQPHFVVPVELFTGNGKRLMLKLPYEILPDLAHMRKYDYQMNDSVRTSLGFDRLYFVTTYHYHDAPELIDYYSLDVEEAHDRHYRFTPSALAPILASHGYHPKAAGAFFQNYYKSAGGPALEKLIYRISGGTFHY